MGPGRLVGWLVGWLVAWSVGWLVGWLDGFIGCVVGCWLALDLSFVICLVVRSVGWFGWVGLGLFVCWLARGTVCWLVELNRLAS